MNYEGWYQYCDHSGKIRGNNFHTLFSSLISYCLMPREVRKEDCMLKQILRPATHEQCTEQGDLVSQAKAISVEANQNYLKSEWKPRLLNAKTINSFCHT